MHMPDVATPPDNRAGIPLDDTSIVDAPALGRIATADALFITDQHQRIVTWSSSAQRVLGYSPEEVVGRPCYLVMMGREPEGHPVCRRNCRATLNARHHRGTASYKVAARARDGETRWLSTSILVVDGGDDGFRILHLAHEETRPARVDSRSAHGREIDADLCPAAEKVTRRELEVLRLVAAGSTTDDIAAELRISRFTVRNHITNLEGKLVARNRLELVLMGMRAGLI